MKNKIDQGPTSRGEPTLAPFKKTKGAFLYTFLSLKSSIFLSICQTCKKKDSSLWILGPSLEGDNRGGTTVRDKLSRTLTHPRWSSLRTRGSRINIFRFYQPLTHRINMDSLPWTLGSSLEGDIVGAPPFVTSCPGRRLNPNRHACESEHPEKLIPLLLALTLL